LWDTLRITAAAAITFVLGVTLGLSQSFWAVIAAVVATQSSLGGTLKASFEQFMDRCSEQSGVAPSPL